MKLQLAAAVMATLVLAGCGSVRYPSSYLLNLPAPAPQAAPPQAPLGPVAVREFRCPDYLCEGRIVFRPSSGGSGVLRTSSLGGQSAPGDHAVDGGCCPGAFTIQERRRSRTWHRGRVCADGQYRAAGRGRRGPRRPGSMHDIRATTGHSHRIRCLESHRIGSGPGPDTERRRRCRQSIGSHPDRHRSPGCVGRQGTRIRAAEVIWRPAIALGRWARSSQLPRTPLSGSHGGKQSDAI